MSKKHTNYQNMYDNTTKHVEEETTSIETAVETEVEAPVVDDVVEEVAEAPEVQEEKKSEVFGIVNCKKLNVRKLPDANGTKLCEIAEGTKVQIDVDSSTQEWYSIVTASGVKGFCMKKFVTVK